MTSRELRKQRREAERKAKKLEYRQNRIAAASAQGMCAGSFAGEPVARPASAEQFSVSFSPNPELLDEFTAEEQEQMMALRARMHARAARMQTDAFTGTEVDTHKLALFVGYQTTNERAFYKTLNTLTKLRQRGSGSDLFRDLLF